RLSAGDGTTDAWCEWRVQTARTVPQMAVGRGRRIALAGILCGETLSAEDEREQCTVDRGGHTMFLSPPHHGALQGMRLRSSSAFDVLQHRRYRRGVLDSRGLECGIDLALVDHDAFRGCDARELEHGVAHEL